MPRRPIDREWSLVASPAPDGGGGSRSDATRGPEAKAGRERSEPNLDCSPPFPALLPAIAEHGRGGRSVAKTAATVFPVPACQSSRRSDLSRAAIAARNPFRLRRCVRTRPSCAPRLRRLPHSNPRFYSGAAGTRRSSMLNEVADGNRHERTARSARRVGPTTMPERNLLNPLPRLHRRRFVRRRRRLKLGAVRLKFRS